MDIYRPFKSGKNGVAPQMLRIFASASTEERLLPKCFRGNEVKKAGNFSIYSSIEGVLEDPVVWEQFLAAVSKSWNDGYFDNFSLTVKHRQYVGWESTARKKQYDLDVLEYFRINRRASGLRVKGDRTDLRAPKTKKLTIILQCVRDKSPDRFGNPAAIIHSLYPGKDIGELKGNVTELEQRVFFDWEHPGEE